MGARFAGVLHQLGQQVGLGLEHVHEGNDQHHQPDGLGQHLQPADGGDAMGDQGDHHHRTDQVAPGGRDAKGQLQRIGHDRGLEREEDESERRVDQRGDGGADVAKACPTGEQVHVDPIAGGIDADGPARQQDQQARGQDGPKRVDEAVLHQQGGAQGLQHQERGHPKCGVGHPTAPPLAR